MIKSRQRFASRRGKIVGRRPRKGGGKWHSRLGIIGYKVLPTIFNPDGVPILGMVARGAKYPYSSMRQDERNMRRYGTLDPPEAGEEWFKNARRIEGRSGRTETT